MAQVKNGDTVKVHYTGKLEDGTVFDSSENREPLEFTVGNAQMIPGFEEAVLGMNKDESKTIQIAPEDAYGQHRQEMVVDVSKDQFPPDLKPEVGMQIQIGHEDGGSTIALITNVSEEAVTLDANHPLAGKELTFDIQVVEIA